MVRTNSEETAGAINEIHPDVLSGSVDRTIRAIPELVRVGLLEDETAAAGIDVDVRYDDSSGWYVRGADQHAALVKI